MGTSPYTCCLDGCLIVADDFNRADSDDPGCNWVKLAGGDYGISGHQLVGTGLLITTRKNPLDTINAVVYVTLRNLQVNNIYRVVVGFVDPDNYRYAKLVCDNSSNLTMSLNKVVNGTHTQLKFDTRGYEGGGDFCAVVCIAEGGNFAVRPASEEPLTVCTPAVGNSGWTPPRVMGNVGFAGGAFDDWSYWEQYADNAECEYCDCTCDGQCLPDTLTVRFVNIQYCDCFDQWSFEIQRDVGSKHRWVLPEPISDPNSDTLSEFYLECITDVPDISQDGKFGITNISGTVFGGFSGGSLGADSRCSPLSLVFGPFGIPGLSGNRSGCCEEPMPPSETAWVWIIVEA